MSAISEKERDRLYGQLIMDFINAKNPDEAFLTLASNIQGVFDFPPGFTEEILRKYPPTSSIPKNFNKLDKTLLEAFEKRIKYHRRRFPEGESRKWREKVSSLSKSFSEERFREIEEKASCYYATRRELKTLEGYHEQIRSLIEEAVDGKSVHEGNWFKTFFNENKILTRISYLALSENGSIYTETEPLFSESSFFDPTGAFRGTLAYCLAVFLKSPNNRALIRKCDKCHKFFVASKNNRNFKKCSACSRKTSMSPERQREYQRDRRIKQKEEKDSKRLEARISNLMKNLDISREEAHEIIEADSML
jgi:hypothetical protein